MEKRKTGIKNIAPYAYITPITLILVTFVRFWRISVPAACLLIPYLAWVTFAGYLNLGVALLN